MLELAPMGGNSSSLALTHRDELTTFLDYYRMPQNTVLAVEHLNVLALEKVGAPPLAPRLAFGTTQYLDC